MNTNGIEIYKAILNKDRKQFPINFWQDNGKEKADIIFKYLIEEILKWDINETINEFNYGIVSKYHLVTPLNLFYNQCVGNIIRSIYPNVIGQRIITDKNRNNLSISHKNLSLEKREKIRYGQRHNRYSEDYAKKLSDTKLGEINPQHKLKTEQVIEIKRLWATGHYSTTSLGEKFNISRQSVADIVYGRTWLHV